MKKTIMNTLVYSLYGFGLLWFVNFNILLLVDVKSLGMSIFGTAILTFPSWVKKRHVQDLLAAAKWNALITAYLITFMIQLAFFSRQSLPEDLIQQLALNCRPLLYGMIIYLLLHKLSESILTNTLEEEAKKNKTKEMLETQESLKPQESLKTPENLESMLRDHQQEMSMMLKNDFGLTERERTILFLVLENRTNKEVASELFISENTVKKHMSNSFKKLNIQSREQMKDIFMK